MAAMTQIPLRSEQAETISRLAEMLHETPEEVAEQIIANGIRMTRWQALWTSGQPLTTPEEGLRILELAGKGNPPDPGDELPEDLQYLLSEDRA